MKRISLIILSLASAVIGMNAQEMSPLPNDPSVRTGKLENGLTYYIRHNDKPAARADFYLATNVGCIQQNASQDGLAHFLEHMCFNGTKNFPDKGIINYLESIGASFGGNVNARTGVEQTIYLLNDIPLVRPTVSDTCILILHDYSHFVECDPGEIEAERGVIIEEKRTRNSGGWRNMENMYKTLFKGSAYENSLSSLIGSEENLKNFTPDCLTSFYHTWYNPWNQAVIVVGDIDVDSVEKSLISIFADVPAPENYTPKEVIKVPYNKKPIVGIFTDPEIPSTNIKIIWKSEPMPEQYNSTTIGLMSDLIKEIIDNVMYERYSELAANPECPFVNARFGMEKAMEYLETASGSVVSKEGKILDSFEALLTEIERMRRYGLSDAEIDRAKTEILSRYETAANKADTRKNSEFVYPLIYNFFDNMPYMEPSTAYQVVQSIMPHISSSIINQVAQGVITKENIAIYLSAPQKDGVEYPSEKEITDVLEKVGNADIAAPAGEEIPTEFLNAAALKGAKVRKTSEYLYGSTTVVLKNGVKVILYPTDIEKDKISIDIFKKGGKSLLSDEECYSIDSDIWSLYCSLTGVSSFSATTVSKMLSGKQVSVNPYISQTIHGISAGTTKKDLETALQLTYLYFTDPRFDEKEYNQGITQLKTILANYTNLPEYKIQEQLFKTAYDSPRQFIISDEVIQKANLETLENCYRRLFADAAGATAVIVGDFQTNDILPLVEKYIGSLPKGGKTTNWKNCGEGYRSGTVENDFCTRMEAPKVSVIQGFCVNGPLTAEKKTVYRALSYILRIIYTNTLREGEGGTYSAGCYPDFTEDPYNQSALLIQFDTNEEQAPRLIELSLDAINGIAQNGPTGEDFDKAQKYFQKTLPEQKLRISFWSGSLKRGILYGGDNLTETEAAINNLTSQKIQSAAQELLSCGNYIKVVMRPEK